MTDYTEQLRKNSDDLERAWDDIMESQARLVDVMSRNLSNWYLSRAKEFVKSDPEKSTRLGEGKLREMKQAVTHLSSNAKLVVEKHLMRSNLWWKAASPGNLEASIPHVSKQSVVSSYEDCRNELADILSKYGYVQTRPEDIITGTFADEAIPFEIGETAGEVQSVFDRARDFVRERSRIKREQAEADVSKNWDEL